MPTQGGCRYALLSDLPERDMEAEADAQFIPLDLSDPRIRARRYVTDAGISAIEKDMVGILLELAYQHLERRNLNDAGACLMAARSSIPITPIFCWRSGNCACRSIVCRRRTCCLTG